MATISLLEEEGYAAMTMQGVAARAGVSTATLYRRWPGKQELVVGTLKSLVSDPEPIDTGSLAGDLDLLLRSMTGKLRSEEGQVMKGIIGEAVRNPALALALREGIGREPYHLITDVVERAESRGEIPPPAKPELVVGLIVGVVQERWLLSDEPLTGDDIGVLVPMLVQALGGKVPGRRGRPAPLP